MSCIPLKRLFCCGRGRGATPVKDEDDIARPRPEQERESPEPRDTAKAGRLWKEAYDILCDQEPDLVESYQSLLLRITHEATTDPTAAAGRQIVKQHGLTGEELDSQLREAAQAGLERTADYEAAVQATGEIADAVLSIRELIRTALAAFPQAAAAWTGVTLVFDGFSNAASESITNRDGLVYVGSLVTWYWKLFNQHPDEEATADGESLDALLSEYFVGLCVKLTQYQMRSVILYYRNWFVRTLRGAFRADQWEDALASIKAEEAILQDRLRQFYGEKTLTNLRGIRTTMNKLWEAMEQFTQDKVNSVIGQFNVKGLDYNALMGMVDDAEPDTCEWVLEEEALRSWTSGVLLIKALPGQGKSVLARFLVQKWKIEGTVCHFFFNDDSRVSKQAANSLCAILHQLLDQHKYVVRLKLVRERITSYGKALMTSVTQLWDVIKLVCDYIDTRVTFVLDALDECAETPDDGTPGRAALATTFAGARMHLLRGLSELPAGNLKVLATSRPVSKVTVFLSTVPSVNLEDRAQELATVIRKVVHGRIERLAEKHDWTEELKEEIARKLLPDGDQFTFLVVKIVFKALDPDDDELVLTGDQWRVLVEKASQGIGSTYGELLAKVNPDLVEQVKRLFSLMVAAREPLTPAELNTAMELCRQGAWKQGRLYMPNEGLMAKWIKQNTALMVTIRRGQVQFIHQTAKEFFIGTRREGDDVEETGPTGSQSSEWLHFVTENGAHGLMQDTCSKFVMSHIGDARRGKTTDPTKPPVFDLDSPSGGSDSSFLRYALANYAFHFDQSVSQDTPGCYFSNGELSYPLDDNPPTAALTSGSAEQLVPAAMAQQFAWDRLRGKVFKPDEEVRIPEIFAVIKAGPVAHTVAEYVGPMLVLEQHPDVSDLLDSSANITHETSYGTLPSLDRILATLLHFISLPVPSDMPVGSFSGGETVPGPSPVREQISDKAKRIFRSNKDLQTKLALLLSYRVGGRSKNSRDLVLGLAKSHFVFTDLTTDQFMFGKGDVVYAVDFRSAAILPTGFMTYALSTSGAQFAQKVGHLLSNRLIQASELLEYVDGLTMVERAAGIFMTRPDIPWWEDGFEKDDKYISPMLRI
ncbi:hypothetical protein F5Y17DRAFT_454943 [Xylariaceae sp. FL0594]|nr:hypothetical protein F5Y17DRAFT_454943 [Xylariaceae sp. FL0594]